MLVERELHRIAKVVGGAPAADAPPARLARELEAIGALSEKDSSAIRGLSVLRSMTAHGGESDASRAREYIVMTEGVLFALRATPAGDAPADETPE